jgi:hypothetical protein
VRDFLSDNTCVFEKHRRVRRRAEEEKACLCAGMQLERLLTFGSVGSETLVTVPNCAKISSRCPSCTLRVRFLTTRTTPLGAAGATAEGDDMATAAAAVDFDFDPDRRGDRLRLRERLRDLDDERENDRPRDLLRDLDRLREPRRRGGDRLRLRSVPEVAAGGAEAAAGASLAGTPPFVGGALASVPADDDIAEANCCGGAEDCSQKPTRIDRVKQLQKQRAA